MAGNSSILREFEFFTASLSPNTKHVLGERGQIVEMLTQGGTSGSCLWYCPGLSSDGPLRLYQEEAASCRFTNVQSLCRALKVNPLAALLQ